MKFSIIPTNSGIDRDLIADCHQRQDIALQLARETTPPSWSGAGIVIVAGGGRSYVNAFVALTILREDLGCAMPIQVWYLGPNEMSDHMVALLKPFDLELVDAFEVRRRFPMRRLGGWEAKIFAILHSPFRHVVLIDADNMAIIDPARMLEWPEYSRSGAIFWPDIQSLPPDSPAWTLCRAIYRNEPEVESGQLVVDKERCWIPLQLTRHFNEWSDIYYRYFLGDKETFHLAWRQLGIDYAMPETLPTQLSGRRSTPVGIRKMAGGLEQFDFEERPIFHHRTGAEWVLLGDNMDLSRPTIERKCLTALDHLRCTWDGRVNPDVSPESGIDGCDVLATKRFLYRRVGIDERLIVFEPNGSNGLGSHLNEQFWRQEPGEHGPCLIISRKDSDICKLQLVENGIWRGHWLWYEQAPVELIPVGLTTPFPDVDR